MTEKLKWGIISPGRIAQTFAKGVAVIPDAEVYAVASSSQERADAFARKFDVPKAYNSYAALVTDPNVDAIYISSLHHQHFAHSLLALEAGKPVLCEKPLTVNATETKKLIETARVNNLFLMEALWTRYLPIYGTIRQWLDEGRIGKIIFMNSTFGFRPVRERSERLYNPALAGGTLLDIGIYPLSVSQWVMQEYPKSFTIQATLGETGVDEFMAGALLFENGVVSQFTNTFLTDSVNDFFIYGTAGHIRIHPDFWGSTQATLVVGDQKITQSAPFRSSGFEYQTEEAMRCIRADLLESPSITHADTLATMELMDDIRAEIDLKYPFE